MPTTGSSRSLRLFEKLRFKSLFEAISCVGQTSTVSVEVLLSIHSKRILHLSESIDFFRALGILKTEGLGLTVSKEYLLDEERFRLTLTDKLFKPKNPYFEAVIDFLVRFDVGDDGKHSMPKRSSASHRGSGLRNFLIELGVLTVKDDAFEISDEAIERVEARLRRYAFTPRMQAIQQAKNRAIGEAAEVLVLAEEKKRLKDYPHLLADVERISLINTGAGYDIRSFWVGLEPGEPREIYIEVKAVSQADLKFYWTRNEIRVATQRRQSYFIYLVPVIDDKLKIDEVVILKDPIASVVGDKRWLRETEVTSFRKVFKK